MTFVYFCYDFLHRIGRGKKILKYPGQKSRFHMNRMYFFVVVVNHHTLLKFDVYRYGCDAVFTIASFECHFCCCLPWIHENEIDWKLRYRFVVMQLTESHVGFFPSSSSLKAMCRLNKVNRIMKRRCINTEDNMEWITQRQMDFQRNRWKSLSFTLNCFLFEWLLIQVYSVATAAAAFVHSFISLLTHLWIASFLENATPISCVCFEKLIISRSAVAAATAVAVSKWINCKGL